MLIVGAGPRVTAISSRVDSFRDVNASDGRPTCWRTVINDCRRGPHEDLSCRRAPAGAWSSVSGLFRRRYRTGPAIDRCRLRPAGGRPPGAIGPKGRGEATTI